MSYEAWRISYQSSEHAAKAAWMEIQRLQKIIDSRPAINEGPPYVPMCPVSDFHCTYPECECK